MADFTQINQEIDDNINQNGVKAITGAKMNTVLKDMVSAVNIEKQDTISDLEDIRDGAAAGATAFQKPSDGIPATDMDENVQAALDNAENAVLYSEQSVGITDQQRNTALANVSNQTANSTTGKMGYKVLDPSKTFASQVTAENTIYEIRDVFDLGGTQETPVSVTLPANSILKFNGGAIKNCTIVGNGSLINGNYCFDNVSFSGSFSNTELDIDNNHFKNNVDFFGILRSFGVANIQLYKDIEIQDFDDSYIDSINLNGNGHTIKVCIFLFRNTANVYAENCVFDCSLSNTHDLEFGFFNIVGNGSNNIVLNNCTFVHIKDGINNTYLRAVKDITIDSCVFEGDFTSEGTPGGRVVFGYDYRNSFIVKNTIIKNCSGVGISILVTDTAKQTIISDCIINNMGLGGIAAQGGMCENPIVRNCIITNTNITNLEQKVADKAAINFHGYRNAIITNNTINTPYSAAIDMEGSDGTTNNRGDGCMISGNKFIGYSITFMASKNTIFDNNVVTLSDCIRFSGKCIISNNIIEAVAKGSGCIYAVSASTASYTLNGDIHDNDITLLSGSTNSIWLFYGNSKIKEGDICNVRNVTLHSDVASIVPQVIILNDVIKLLDGFSYVTMDLNLNESKTQIIIPRSTQGRITSVDVYTKNTFFLESPISVHLGLFRPGVGGEAVSFGDLSISGNINTNSRSLSLNNQKPNNEIYPSIGDVYATFAGTELTDTIYLSFAFTNGKYTLYY